MLRISFAGVSATVEARWSGPDAAGDVRMDIVASFPGPLLDALRLAREMDAVSELRLENGETEYRGRVRVIIFDSFGVVFRQTADVAAAPAAQYSIPQPGSMAHRTQSRQLNTTAARMARLVRTRRVGGAVVRINPNNNDVNGSRWDSVTDAARAIGVNTSTLVRGLNLGTVVRRYQYAWAADWDATIAPAGATGAAVISGMAEDTPGRMEWQGTAPAALAGVPAEALPAAAAGFFRMVAPAAVLGILDNTLPGRMPVAADTGYPYAARFASPGDGTYYAFWGGPVVTTAGTFYDSVGEFAEASEIAVGEARARLHRHNEYSNWGGILRRAAYARDCAVNAVVTESGGMAYAWPSVAEAARALAVRPAAIIEAARAAIPLVPGPNRSVTIPAGARVRISLIVPTEPAPDAVERAGDVATARIRAHVPARYWPADNAGTAIEADASRREQFAINRGGAVVGVIGPCGQGFYVKVSTARGEVDKFANGEGAWDTLADFACQQLRAATESPREIPLDDAEQGPQPRTIRQPRGTVGTYDHRGRLRVGRPESRLDMEG